MAMVALCHGHDGSSHVVLGRYSGQVAAMKEDSKSYGLTEVAYEVGKAEGYVKGTCWGILIGLFFGIVLAIIGLRNI